VRRAAPTGPRSPSDRAHHSPPWARRPRSPPATCRSPDDATAGAPAAVVPPGAGLTTPTATCRALMRTGRDHQPHTLGVLIEAHVLDDRPLKSYLSMQYPGQTHAVSRSSVSLSPQVRNLDGTRRALVIRASPQPTHETSQEPVKGERPAWERGSASRTRPAKPFGLRRPAPGAGEAVPRLSRCLGPGGCRWPGCCVTGRGGLVGCCGVPAPTWSCR
jgi:hypothetical protein